MNQSVNRHRAALASNREYIGWIDLWRSFLGALVITLITCGSAYVGAGGPVPYLGQVRYAMSNTAQTQIAPVTVTEAVTTLKTQTPKIHTYRVRPGDTLSIIAKRLYGKAEAWTVIYWANQKSIPNPDTIYVGSTFSVPSLPRKIPAPPRMALQDAASSMTKSAVLSSSTTTSTGGAPTYSGSTSMQQCIIARESGGNPNIWNATGHWGLYQFSASTWSAHGGDPSLFGHASIAYQNQIFFNTVAVDGYSDWAPYDGC